MLVLVTRAEDENLRLAAVLRESGHQPLLSPLTSVHLIDGPELDLDSVQGIVVTSANGVRALERRVARRDVPILAVGPHTARLATAAGFATVKQAHGNARYLAESVRGWSQAEAGALLHVTGRDHGNELAKTLRGYGFDVRVEIVYAAEPALLTATAIAALAAEEVDAVMLFSPRNARLFCEQIEANALQPSCAAVTALCFSKHVGAALSPLTFKEVRIAQQPEMHAMLGLLER